MGARFIIGRAGTGKTALCAREIAAELASQPLGSALFWITPEQGTFAAERLLLTGQDRARGSFRAQVLSFRRLSMLIARETGILDADRHAQTPMEEVARLVLLEEVVRKEKDRGSLKVFAAVADRPGFIRKLDATLRELRQHGHSGASLRQLAADPANSRRLSDLALLLDAWSKIVDADHVWDWERIMHAAAQRAGQSALLTADGGASLWVDGISAMSTLEMRLLAALALHARQVSITLLADPDSPALKELRAQEGDGLFARTERLHRRLIDTFRKQAVQIDLAILLRQPHRFANPTLQRIESELWSPSAETRTTSHESPTTNHDLTLWQAADPETEVRIVAQAIRELVIQPNEAHGNGPPDRPRYRQIGIIIPDLEGYADAVRRIFIEHQIPHFVDTRRTLPHHPVVELARSIVAIATVQATSGDPGEQGGMWDRDDLLLYLKTGLAGVTAEDVALLENYIIAHGITRYPWTTPWTWLEPNVRDDGAEDSGNASAILARINQTREKVWQDLKSWTQENALRRAAATPPNAAHFARDLKKLLTHLGVEAQIERWAQAAREAHNPELAQTHQQAWREVHALLDMLETLLAGKPRTLEEFASLLNTALENLTLGLIPPTVDQVLVSSVMRSRTPELDIVFILGAIEGQLPKVVEEDPILSDAQREGINASGAEPIGEGAARQLLEMPFFDYVAFTRAGRRLIISHPIAGLDGRATGPSRYIARLKELFAIEEQKFDAASRTRLDRIGTPEDLLSSVVAWVAAETGGATVANPACESLYNWILGEESLRDARTLAWDGLRGRPQPQLGDRLARLFYPRDEPLRMSVSQLETFAACPLQYFFHYTLGLTERKEFQLDAMDLGSLYHKVLERLYLRIIRKDFPWPGDPQPLHAALVKEVDTAIADLHGELAQRTPGYEKTRARAKRLLARVVEADRRRANLSPLRPAGVEVFFERGEQSKGSRIVSLPILELDTPAGRRIHLRGKIDRMDESANRETTIIDYKSSSKKKLDLNEVLLGIALQLPLYAILMRLTGRNPIASLFMPLTAPRQTVEHAGDIPDPQSDDYFTPLKPRGMIDAAHAALLDPDVEQARSLWYAAGFNKDGSIPKSNSDLLVSADFAQVLRYIQWIITTLADQLTAGQIAPNPYRKSSHTPCQHCDFTTLCPFDQVRGAYRLIEKQKPPEAVEAMRGKIAGI